MDIFSPKVENKDKDVNYIKGASPMLSSRMKNTVLNDD